MAQKIVWTVLPYGREIVSRRRDAGVSLSLCLHD